MKFLVLARYAQWWGGAGSKGDGATAMACAIDPTLAETYVRGIFKSYGIGLNLRSGVLNATCSVACLERGWWRADHVYIQWPLMRTIAVGNQFCKRG